MTGVTFGAWVKGTNTSATPQNYEVANNVFGDTTGSVWMGAGVSSGKAAVRGGGSEIRSNKSVADNAWHHIGFVFTFNGSVWNAQVYVDGVADGSGTLDSGGNGNYACNTIGRTYTNYTQYFGYSIDSVYIFTTALSPGQMATLATTP